MLSVLCNASPPCEGSWPSQGGRTTRHHQHDILYEWGGLVNLKTLGKTSFSGGMKQRDAEKEKGENMMNCFRLVDEPPWTRTKYPLLKRQML